MSKKTKSAVSVDETHRGASEPGRDAPNRSVGESISPLSRRYLAADSARSESSGNVESAPEALPTERLADGASEGASDAEQRVMSPSVLVAGRAGGMTAARAVDVLALQAAINGLPAAPPCVHGVNGVCLACNAMHAEDAAERAQAAAHPAVAATRRLWEMQARMADPATRAEREARERAADEARAAQEQVRGLDVAPPEPAPYYLCRIRSGRREYHAAGGWLVAPDNAETRAGWELGRGEFTVPVGEAERPDVESAGVLRADATALVALRDWETAVAEVDRRYPPAPGAESLERRCRARVDRALAAADREARS